MTQLDMFEELKPKIYESPDKGKTVYARNFGETERVLIHSPNQNDVTLHDTMQGLQ